MNAGSRILLCLIPVTVSLTTAAGAAPPAHQWSKGFGDATTSQLCTVAAVDQLGNVIVAGEFLGSIDFGGGPMTAGFQDGFVAKFDAAGNHLWSMQFSAPNDAVPAAISSDASNNIIVSGVFTDSVDLGGGALISAGSRDVFVAKLAPDGSHIWSKRFGGVGGEVSAFSCVGNMGQIGLAVTFADSIDFGGGPLNAPDWPDVAVAVLDPSGNHVWSGAYLDPSFSDFARPIAFDASGNVFVLAMFGGTIDFGGGPLISAGDLDIGLAKFDAAGAHLWSKRFGNTLRQQTNCLEVDGAGNVWLAGNTPGTINFGGAPLVSAGLADVFVAKFDGVGNHVWSKLYGDAQQQSVNGTTVDAAGNILLSGTLIGSMDFGGGPIASSDGDVYVAKLDASGNHIFSARYGAAGTNLGADVAVNPAGDEMALVGGSSEDIDFGGGNIPVTAPNPDAFVAHFSIGQTVPVFVQSFEARPRTSAIEIRWRFAYDEPIERVVLYRSAESSSMRAIWERAFDASVRSYVDADVQPDVRYSYELAAYTSSGDVYRSPITSATLPALPAYLGQNEPNPFNANTTMTYTLSVPARVAIVVYDATGAVVARLDQGARGPGKYAASWDGRDSNHRTVASGVYFYRLEGVARVEPRRMLLLR